MPYETSSISKPWGCLPGAHSHDPVDLGGLDRYRFHRFRDLLPLTALGDGLSSGGAAAEFTASLTAQIGKLSQLHFIVPPQSVGVLLVFVPEMYHASGDTTGTEAALTGMMYWHVRYLLAGLLFTIAAVIGFVLCILPGIFVNLTLPVHVKTLFLCDVFLGGIPVLEALSSSFQDVLGSPQGRLFTGIELLAWLMVSSFTFCLASLVKTSLYRTQPIAENRWVRAHMV